MHECTLRIRRADRSVPLRLQQSDMQKSLKEWSATDNKSHGPKGWWRRRWHKLITRVRNGTNFSPTFWPFGSYKITCIAHRAERHLWAPYIVFLFRFFIFFFFFFFAALWRPLLFTASQPPCHSGLNCCARKVLRSFFFYESIWRWCCS